MDGAHRAARAVQAVCSRRSRGKKITTMNRRKMGRRCVGQGILSFAVCSPTDK
jgi:hypothetical protein